MSSYFSIIFLFIILFFIFRDDKQNLNRKIIKNKKKGRVRMNEVISRYIGKDCLVYLSLMSSVIEGEIVSVNDNWVIVKTKDGDETVNLDYIVRIKEHPRKSNGKKKSVVF